MIRVIIILIVGTLVVFGVIYLIQLIKNTGRNQSPKSATDKMRLAKQKLLEAVELMADAEKQIPQLEAQLRKESLDLLKLKEVVEEKLFELDYRYKK